MKTEDIKKRLEELQFLNKLDIRIGTIVSLLEYHEKYLVSMSGAKREQIDRYFKGIEETHKQIIEQLAKSEQTINEHFQKCMKELEESEGNTDDV